MSVEIGQENPQTPFNRDPRGFRAYMLDGSIIRQEVNSPNQFKNRWNSLDHTNLVAVNLFQNQRYGRVDKDKVARWKNYKTMIHTNDDEFTHYWMDDTSLQIALGNSVDIPANAHSYPTIVRDPSITRAAELLAFEDNLWS
jgi:deoxycytidine triphosphate deaminase